jgi:hypothetical protein
VTCTTAFFFEGCGSSTELEVEGGDSVESLSSSQVSNIAETAEPEPEVSDIVVESLVDESAPSEGVNSGIDRGGVGGRNLGLLALFCPDVGGETKV